MGYFDVIDPNVGAVVDLDSVPIFGLAWPVGGDSCVAHFEVAEDDVARSLDGETSA